MVVFFLVLQMLTRIVSPSTKHANVELNKLTFKPSNICEGMLIIMSFPLGKKNAKEKPTFLKRNPRQRLHRGAEFSTAVSQPDGPGFNPQMVMDLSV